MICDASTWEERGRERHRETSKKVNWNNIKKNEER